MVKKVAVGMLLVSSLGGRVFGLSHVRRGPTSHHHSTHNAKVVAKPASVKTMDSARAVQIQSALIKSGYLSGEPSGRWDDETQAAMKKFQQANGWQSKLTPDSRALIKLGLGPDSSQSGDSSTMHADPFPLQSQNESTR